MATKGKSLAIGFLATLVLVVAFVFWLGATGGGTANRQRTSALADGGAGALATSPTAAGSAGAAGTPAVDAGRIAQTVVDKHVRDELRRRIFEAWAAEGTGEVATAARAGKLPPMPESPDGGVDPQYIRDVVRSDFFPLAGKCYEELLSRKKGARGRLVVKFKVVGDSDLGGIVEEAEIETDGGLGDERLATCMRESMLSVAFRPPPRDGWVTVTYPIELSPDDEAPAKGSEGTKR